MTRLKSTSQISRLPTENVGKLKPDWPNSVFGNVGSRDGLPFRPDATDSSNRKARHMFTSKTIHHHFALFLSLCLGMLAFSVAGCIPNEKPENRQADSNFKTPRSLPSILEREEYLKADFRVLFIGNSHTSTCLMPKTVETLLNDRQSEKKVYCAICAGSFLSDHLSREKTTNLIENGKWDVVVLQAQKYSVSRSRDYPIDAALALTKMAEKSGAKVVMYPEFGQRQKRGEAGVESCIDEARYVHQLYESIVKKSGAAIAPVGLCWNEALTRHPDWHFHSDGNHANELGAFLTAAVFEKCFLDEFLKTDSDKVVAFQPDSKFERVDVNKQKELREIAAKVIRRAKANSESNGREKEGK